MAEEYASSGGGDFGKFIFWFCVVCGIIFAVLFGVGRGPRADECDYMGCHAPPTMTLRRVSTGELGRFCDPHGLKKLKSGEWTTNLIQ